MKRKWRVLPALLAAILATVCLPACRNSAPEDTGDADSNYRVAKKSPEAFEDYGQTRSADYYIKATGYDYDRDSLTYKQVWADEFDYEGLPDPEKWTYDVGTGQGGWGNNELERYTDDGNAWVKDGVLTIELRKEKDGAGNDIYTSARLKTSGKGDWLYGKFEIRAKLPKGKGTWPAIWMLPSDKAEYGGWPASGEIDIMEHVGYLQNVLHHNVHTKDFNGADGTNKGRSYAYKNVSEEFHTYALEWLPDKMIFSVDGTEQFTYDPHEYAEEVKMEQWPFDKEFHLMLNVAYGGNWGGAIGVDDSKLPQQMQIDYVRVSQSDEITKLAEEK